MKDYLKKLIREPLLHFVLLGVLIFFGYSILSKAYEEPSNIVITKGDINSIITSFVNMRQRQPSQEEFDALIKERVRQEVYRREAVALGLDKDDIIIERRLEQKMEFIVEDNADEATPTDTQLQNYLLKHQEQFKLEPQFTFRQIFLNPDSRGNSIDKSAAKILVELNHNDDHFQKYGDATLLPIELTDARETEISNQFGNEFKTQLKQLPKGRWAGPFKSTYGLHIVKVSEYTDGRIPALVEIRESVIAEWGHSHRAEANEIFYQELLKNYKVTIEKIEQ
jgi:hypothetical protein